MALNFESDANTVTGARPGHCQWRRSEDDSDPEECDSESDAARLDSTRHDTMVPGLHNTRRSHSGHSTSQRQVERYGTIIVTLLHCTTHQMLPRTAHASTGSETQ